MTVSSAKLLCHERLSADDPQRISADFAAVYTYAADFAAIDIPNLTEPDLAPTEVRSPLSAAFGRIDPTVIAFIFARHYLRPSAALTLQRYPSYSLATTCGLRPH